MHRTPWTSLPSDRIRPTYPQPTPKQKSKGSGSNTPKDPPKSKEIRRLESLLKALRNTSSNAKDPIGGCFCQAREHALSTDTPICRQCGLILCSLNLPSFACPHCSAALLTPPARDALIAKLESQISEQLAREFDAAELAREEARKAVGAFPTLSGRQGKQQQQQQVNQTHKVLSLNSQTKRVVVSSYTTPPPSTNPSTPNITDSASGSRAQTPEPYRVPPPPDRVPCADGGTVNAKRPWRDLRRSQEVVYVPVAKVEAKVGETVGKSSRKGKGKQRGGEGTGEGSAGKST